MSTPGANHCPWQTATAIALFLCAGCQADERHEATSWHGTVDTIGDTIRVTTAEGSVLPRGVAYQIDTLRILYQSDSLGWPSVVVMVNDSTLMIADDARIHVVGMNGTLRTLVSREGEGPGEFLHVGGLAAWRGDSVVAWDPHAMRATWLDEDGRYGRSVRVFPPERLPAGEDGDMFASDSGLVLRWYTGFVDPGGPPPEHAIATHSYDGAVRIIAAVPGYRMIRTDLGTFVPQNLFGARPLIAVSGTGRAALSTGVEYCITQTSITDTRITRTCRNVSDLPVPSSMRSPDFATLAEYLNDRELEQLRSRMRVQEMPSQRNLISNLKLDSQDRLWVRRENDLEKYDSMITGRHPDLKPTSYQWDVFAPDGRLLTEVQLPARLEPRLITPNAVIGTVTLESGERVVGILGLRILKN